MDTPTQPSTAYVPVNLDTLKLATQRTGINDAAELVEFALRLLTSADPSADFARERRETMPGFDLDT